MQSIRVSFTTFVCFCLSFFSMQVFADDSVGTLPGSFAVSPSGAATYTIPIEVPPGVNGMQPELAFVYNSQAGNGPLGVGWSLAGLSAITRCPVGLSEDDDYLTGGVNRIDGVDYDENDQFCLDGEPFGFNSWHLWWGGFRV